MTLKIVLTGNHLVPRLTIRSANAPPEEVEALAKLLKRIAEDPTGPHATIGEHVVDGVTIEVVDGSQSA